MKLFKYFLRGISLGTSIAFLSSCASMMASIEYPTPTHLSLTNGGLKPVDKYEGKDEFARYCSGSKQIKNVSLNFTFVMAKNPVGWPINEAGAYMKKLNENRRCFNQRLFFILSKTPDCQTHYGSYVTDLKGQKLCAPQRNSEDGWILSSNESKDKVQSELKQISPTSSFSNLFLPVIVRSKEGNISVGYFVNEQEDHFQNIKTKLGEDVTAGHVSDWTSLINNYTILEPLEFQKATYNDESDKEESNACGNQDDYNRTYGLDEDQKISTSEAINDREKIWSRYISRFTKVKESSKSAQTINVQLTLDLNTFCKYGRSVESLSSK